MRFFIMGVAALGLVGCGSPAPKRSPAEQAFIAEVRAKQYYAVAVCGGQIIMETTSGQKFIFFKSGTTDMFTGFKSNDIKQICP